MVAKARPIPRCLNCGVPRHEDGLCRKCRKGYEVRLVFDDLRETGPVLPGMEYAVRARGNGWPEWSWLHADLDRFGPLWRSPGVLGRSTLREPTRRVRRPQRGSEGAQKLLRETLANGDSMPAMQYAAVIGHYQMGLSIKGIARTWGKHRQSVQQAISGACRRFGIGVG